MSVRTRLMAVIAAAVAVGLAGVGGAVYVVERQRILASTDVLLQNNLEAAQVLVDAHVADDPTATASDALRVVVQRVGPDDNMGVLGIVNGEGVLVPGVELDVQLESQPGFVDHVTAEANGSDAVLGRYAADDVVWQYLAAPIRLSDDQSDDVLFVMGYDLEAELAEINEPGRAYLAASAVAILLVIAVGALAAGRLLRPLRQMRETAERVSGQELDERLPVEGRDDVSELARTMNDMLDRLDQALDSQRQLLSDVRHELRTPITIVRGHLELLNPDDAAEVRETQELAVDELDRMNALVQDLSESASLHGRAAIRAEPIDVRELLVQIVRKADALDGAQVSAGPGVTVVAPLDESRITQAVLQLAQNAVTHGGGQIVIGSRLAGDMLEVWVRDHGAGVPDEEKAHIFERFRRGAGSGRGSGLGLSIVQMIARAHGGSARVVDPRTGPGSVFVLSLPLQTPDVPTAPVPPNDEEKEDPWRRS
ncbi:two-component sensor histidine kinase [Frigoribacterium sp. JB110]|nr:two-component sensor histidine kinase [Frigoribacterium sp. JB110]